MGLGWGCLGIRRCLVRFLKDVYFFSGCELAFGNSSMAKFPFAEESWL